MERGGGILARTHPGDVIAEHGDSLQYRDTHSAEAFNRLAEGLAAAAYQPGGVSFAGMLWEA